MIPQASLILLVAMSAGNGTLRPKVISVSYFEINHVHDDGWNHLYSQVILWDWCSEYRRHNVSSWYVHNGDKPLPSKQNGAWVLERHLIDGRVVRFVSGVLRETWTQEDPERENKRLMEEYYKARKLKILRFLLQ